MLGRILQIKSKTITFSAFLLAFFAFLSGLLGVIRDNLLANSFSFRQTDIYLVAFRIPELVYAILITGGVVAAFLPVFSDYYRKSERDAKILTANVLFFFTIFLVLLCLLFFILAPFLIKLLVPGFSVENQREVVLLTRIMFLSPILLGISSILSGVLQYFQLFLAFALAPILYNVGIIIGILILAPLFGLKGLAMGVVLGAVMHLGIQLPLVLKKGFSIHSPEKRFNFKHVGLRKIFKLMGPRILGTTVSQANLIIITVIASTLPLGVISILNYSNNLQGLPITLIGLSFAIAAFPSLAKSFAGGQEKEFRDSFSSIFCQIIFLITPVSFLFFILRRGIVKLVFGQSIFGHVRFGPGELNLLATFFGIFSLALFAGVLIPFLVRVFFALQDTLTPVYAAFSAIVFNLFASFFSIHLLSNNLFLQGKIAVFLGVDPTRVPSLGLVFALALANFLQFFLLLFWLKKKLPSFRFRIFMGEVFKIIFSGFLMAVLVYTIWHFVGGVFFLFGFFNLLVGLMFILFAGFSAYCLICFMLKCDYLRIIWRSTAEQFRK